ncbi:helix-turn-helix transcriptional regulator [Corynebacterium gallinarum]|uniref:Helix-turn-helix domain-containing protein n=1 Tax=Corynebacterium gallinarum TaxID=2762214 RepID=A0A8I0HJJ0_9CORY|nr:helix-turn-helix domain-containing protein [Corynebacterium gallinarum]
MLIDKWLSTTQAAKYLGLTTRTLYNWRANNTGPRHVRNADNHALYRVSDLDDWIDASEADTLSYRRVVKQHG